MREFTARTRTILNLDTGAKYIFTAKTAYEAMQKMIYTLNISEKCNTDNKINECGNILYFIYKDNTYATVNI